MPVSAEIGLIGGTGVYDPMLLKNSRQINAHTPYGHPSDRITLGELKGRKIAFIPRHGSRHTIPPHLVNYRANIWALKQLGVTRILAPCAVGSLQENIKPGEFVFADQFVDHTKSRKYTFYEGPQVCHISVAEPFCSELRDSLIACAKKMKLPHHENGTYVTIEGPRFSTKAESRIFRNYGSVIGMTLSPECILAREAQVCYAPIASVTDYDSFASKPVDAAEVIATMKHNAEKVRQLVTEVVSKIPKERKCACKTALEGALL
jgi:5'-methylthioadenosine phosphorylase